MISLVLILTLALRAIAGGALLFAGLTKLQLETAVRATTIRSYRIVPGFAEGILAWLLPISEVVFGVAIILGATPPVFSIGASCLLGVLTAALCVALIRRLKIKCGCFGNDRLISWRLLIRNLVLATITITISVLRMGIEVPSINILPLSVQLGTVGAICLVVTLAATLRRRRPYSALQRA